MWWASGPARSWVGGPVSVQGARQAVDESLELQEYLKLYREAPWVVGELDLVMTSIEPRADGSNRIHYVRRIEEWVDIEGAPQTVLDQRQRLRRDPAELRELSARRKRNAD